MSRVALVEPHSGGRISGGFAYNARMAEQGLWARHGCAPEELAECVSRLSEARLLLLDSIWLTEQHASRLLSRRSATPPRPGPLLGTMLHSLPSMIAATEAGEPPPEAPSAFEREVLGALDVVVVPGTHYHRWLRRGPARVVVASPGIDDAWRAAPRARQGPCRLVSVGAVTPRKGFLDVAEVLASHPEPDYTWTVIGSLSADAGYSERLRELARGRPIELLGQQPPEQVRAAVRRADVLVMPSYDENQPLVVLEALAASVPVVAYAAGAVRDMIEHGEQGLITAVGDKSALGHHLGALLADEPRRHAMAQACWQRQRGLPSWQAAASSARSALAETIETASKEFD